MLSPWARTALVALSSAIVPGHVAMASAATETPSAVSHPAGAVEWYVQALAAGHPCGEQRVDPLALTRPWRGDVPAGERVCLSIDLRSGEFVRLTVAPAAGAIAARLYAPESPEPSLTVSAPGGRVPPAVVSWEAAASGTYLLVLDATIPGYEAENVRVDVQERQDPSLRARTRAALASDPRVAWLRDSALALRSISPDDADFSDLEPLRGALAGVRVVLLGESNHGNGSDFLARARLVRFLHQELGFDVLAFESGLYDMHAAWTAMRDGVAPHEAFARGAFGVWAGAEQMTSLISYVGAVAQGDRPLELAGFDMQFSGEPGERFAADLQPLLTAHGIQGPLAEASSPERDFVTALASTRFCNVPASALPDSAARARVLAALDEAAERIAVAVSGRQGMFWKRVVENAAVCARDNFGIAPAGAHDVEPGLVRDWWMAHNLAWLANEHYAGRKIIAWGHSGHFVRNLGRMVDWAWSDYTMGDAVWEEFGEESFVIGATSFGGQYKVVNPRLPAFDVVTDVHPLFEFEELMDAAGIDYGLVNLREARARGTWLTGRFPARPSGATPSAWWHEHFDALLFIGSQEPRRERVTGSSNRISFGGRERGSLLRIAGRWAAPNVVHFGTTGGAR